MASESESGNTSQIEIQQIRNATVKIEYAGTTFLVDPMLADKDAYPGFQGTVNSQLRYPLVDLPVAVEEVIEADAVIVTHTHADHWDEAAQQMIPKNMPIFAQNEQDAEQIRQDGFTDVRLLNEETEFDGTQLVLTDGQHGTDEIMATMARALGTTSGIIFKREGYKTTYVAGDTVWTGAVEEAISTHKPDVIVLNSGDARLEGFEGSIIMGKEDVLRAYNYAPEAVVINSHMEAVNHGTLSRDELRQFINETGMEAARVLVPEDGETYRL